MRLILLMTTAAMTVAGPAFGQPTSRVSVGPVIRLDTISVEGGGGGGTGAGGVLVNWNASRWFGFEAELTRAWDRVERSYDGWFISYAGPNATEAEIVRLAPTARRTLAYVPGVGGSAAVVVRTRPNRRITVSARAGLAARRYLETSTFTILAIPQGVDPLRLAADFPSSAHHRTRGGLLLGSDLSFAVSRRLSLGPEIRFVYGGPARIGNKHRELGVGVRTAWQF